MHLLIDCRSIHRAMGGIGRAAQNLLAELAAHPRGHRITALIGAECPEEAIPGGIEAVQAEAGMIDEMFEQLGLPVLLDELKVDAYLNTTFSIPALAARCKQLAIIHDVVFEDHPEWVEDALRAYLQKWSRFAARHADRIITVSQHAKSRIMGHYGIAADRIAVIPNGIASGDFLVPSAAQVAEVAARLALGRDYLLYLGTCEIKKGIPELLAAFALLVEGGYRGTLVLAGGKGGPAYDLAGELRRLGIHERVRNLGYVSDADKRPLLAGAQLLVYPSRYEGFGLPPLEALALGTPCVVSGETSIPEAVGPHALQVDVTDAPRFAEALRWGLAHQPFRAAARSQGPAWAQRFSWRAAADAYLDACESLMAS
jgi:glycosyltransferase involved in cell wall biosynthesis